MSMELMVKAMKTTVGNPLRKLVLLKLADNASDKGECWPSYQHIADQCEISKSTAREHIKALANMGLVTIENRMGPNGHCSNVYHLHLDAKPADPMPPGGTPMPGDGTPMPAGGTPPMPAGGTRTSHSSEPVIEPETPDGVSPRKRAKSPALDFSGWPEQPSAQVLADWKTFRRQKRAPITQTVIDQMAIELRKARVEGFRVDHCLAAQQAAGWQGFKFDWLKNREAQHAQGNRGPYTGPVSRSDRSDQALREYLQGEQGDDGDGLASPPSLGLRAGGRG